MGTDWSSWNVLLKLHPSTAHQGHVTWMHVNRNATLYRYFDQLPSAVKFQNWHVVLLPLFLASCMWRENTELVQVHNGYAITYHNNSNCYIYGWVHEMFTIVFVKLGLTTLLLERAEMLITLLFCLKDMSMTMLPTLSVSLLFLAVQLGLSWNKASRPYTTADIRGLLPVVSRLSRVEERFTMAGGSSGISSIGSFAAVMFIIRLNRPAMLGVK